MITKNTQLGGGISLECVLMTPEGLVPLAWLKAGDLVETRDTGFQAIVRIDPIEVSTEQVVDLASGVLAGQRVLAAGWPVEMYFGFDEMLVQAGDVSGVVSNDVPRQFGRIVLGKPALVRVGDIWAESYDAAEPLHPVLSRRELELVNHAFGCPVVRCEDAVTEEHRDVSTTFGSRAAVA